ncbi:beta strand repeat-containing protein [Gemmatimonas phototrophica]|uniref:beta strand repeat-containing protein n=1 Tax=Gemmatimonas phototrophica TaxID=1379270 RepID=UPI00047A94BC|nr:hypothetical protein [Gemmatimonas phototrophica]
MLQPRRRVDVGAADRPRRSILSLGALSLAGFATIWACGGGGGGDTPPITPPPTVTPTIAISNSAAISGQQGTTQTSTITLTRGGNYTGAVTLSASGAPSGVTVTLTPSTLSGSTTTSTLSAVIAGTAAATTTGNITVTATGSGVSSATASVPVTVTAAPSPDFTLSPSTANATVIQGQSSAATAFTLARVNSYTGEVILSAAALPTGITVAFTQPLAGSAGSVVFTALSNAGTGTYPITITASGPNTTAKTSVVTLVVQATPTVVLGLTPPSLSLAQGGSGQTAIAITRTNITGDVTLTAENVPQGVTAAFTPSATSGTTSSLALTVGGAVTPGVYTITVRGSAAGATAGTATVTLTVTAAQSYALAATSASVQQGNTGTSTVSITRTGGFTGAVTLAASNLPNGVTAAFAPNATTGNSSTMTLTASGAATPGSYTVTITGTAAGLANVTTTASVTVTASGGGSGSINWRFCDQDNIPTWFAVKDGTGPWTRVLVGSQNTYSFSVNAASVGIAYAVPKTGGVADVSVYYYAASELPGEAAAECADNPATKSLTGTVANVALLQQANVGVGGSNGVVSGPSTTYSLTGVADGVTDLLAFRSTLNIGAGVTTVPNAVILRRNVNYANGSAIPLLDFSGGEAFAPATATYTLANSSGENATLVVGFNTANGSVGNYAFGALASTSTSLTAYGIPSNRTQAGDFHFAIATSATVDASSFRILFQYNRDLANRTLTLGAPMATPTLTTASSSPYTRLKLRGAWTNEYNASYGCSFTQGTTTTRVWTVSATRGYYASQPSEYELETPDFSGVAGFQNTWGLLSGQQVQWAVTGIGPISGTIGVIAEGTAYKAASRQGNITP